MNHVTAIKVFWRATKHILKKMFICAPPHWREMAILPNIMENSTDIGAW